MDIIRICTAAAVSLILIAVTSDKNRSGGIAAAIAAAAVLTSAAVPEIRDAVSAFKEMADSAGVESGIFTPVFRTVGICICVRITAELCRDNGERAIAAAVELAGTAAGLIAALPLIETAVGRLVRP